MLDRKLLDAYCADFLGYGNLASPIWFIGMEEGGGLSQREVEARISAWGEAHSATVNLVDHHVRFGEGRWFRSGAPTQSTRRMLIKTLLRARNHLPVTAERVRAYQIGELGRPGSEVALLEMFPLPKQTRKSWKFGGWYPHIDFLRTRREYERKIGPSRIESLRDAIALHVPRVVIFYGLGFRSYWKEIASLETLNSETFVTRKNVSGAPTSYMQLPHPVSFGTVQPLFERAGDQVRLLDLLGGGAER